jgi:two-component system sensor histidine kinase PilS (NtrC family)
MSSITAITDQGSQNRPNRPWRSLHIFNLYRLIVVGVSAITFFFAPPGSTTFGQKLPDIFGTTIIIWVVLIFLSGFASRLQWPNFRIQVYALILGDIGLIALLMYASGGIISGLGTLMLVTIAAGGILVLNIMPYVFAAIAALAILSVQGYTILTSASNFQSASFTQSGLLGAGFFAVALLSHIMAQRIRASEILAEQRGEELEDLSHINELIIRHLSTGILVIDHEGIVKLINKTAGDILGATSDMTGKPLKRLSEILHEQLSMWRSTTTTDPLPFRTTPESSETLPGFTQLGGHSGQTTLISLEDTALLSHQAQQVKLASLGRLTASVAHEIRNPLSAINHASQLLAETQERKKEDERLIEIIQQQTKRLNTIVENILSLSRKQDFNPVDIDITEWLRKFKANMLLMSDISDKDIQLFLPDTRTIVNMDANHLEQVVSNLCNNGIRYSRENQSTPLLEIHCHKKQELNTVTIDIIDFGRGVNESYQSKLFEPFFTTQSTGTGLGLYIARELCELNHARLQYVESDKSGAHFRINFMPIQDNK